MLTLTYQRLQDTIV